MIDTDMRTYNYSTLAVNEYGQQTQNPEPQGEVKIAIYPFTTVIQNNIKYSQANFIGLTFDKNISENYIIQYGSRKLKVLYIQPGRYILVYMVEI